MERRLDRTDFRRAAGATKNPAKVGILWVCEDYDIRDSEIIARWSLEEHAHWWAYNPLEETPDLFMELAALHEQQAFAESAIAFTRKRGLPNEGGRFPGVSGYGFGKMSLADFSHEAGQAWLILKIYEAALNRNHEQAKSLEDEYLRQYMSASDDLDDTAELFRLQLLETYAPPISHSGSDPERVAPHKTYIQDALSLAVSVVNAVIRDRCREIPFLTEEFYSPETAISGIQSVWTYDDLLAAAYLQMWWLMTSGGDVARCEHCRRPMSHGRPLPDGRKRRRDKRFCSDSCRQANHRSKKKT